MAIQAIIDLQQLQRELSRFCSRIGMQGLPRFDGRQALVFNTAGGRLSFELNRVKSALLISYAVTPELAETETLLKKALQLSCYKGGYVLSVMYVDPYLVMMSKLNSSDISAEAIENVLMQLIRVWEEIRHGS